ncbi:fatty acyl-AMP ligase [Salinispora pacifica]|uniref:fatty acyl-AMP ligase n=1 Tax=Salinispora pacifica TaxID=351187 RepID=UPI00036B638B|nr:fatty acyl-AMP ligase [Salinispora pacifica]
MSDLTTAPDLVSLFRERAGATPDGQAVVHVIDVDTADGFRSWTYGQLDREARRVAVHIRQLAPEGSRILLLYPVGLPFVAAFLGCLYAGVIAVPAPLPGRFQHQRRRLRAIATDALVAAVFTDEANFAEATGWAAGEDGVDAPVVATDVAVAADPDTWAAPALGRETVALLQYTSGSTGDSKGVILTHGNLLANMAGYVAAVGLTPELRSGGWLPLYHDMGLSAQLLPPLMVGGNSVLLDPMSFLRRPVSWLRLIDRFGLGISFGPNFGYDLCARKVTDEQLEDLDLSRWRYAINGSEPIQPSVMAAFAKRFAGTGFRETAFSPSYGLAEAVVYVSTRGDRPPLIRAVDAERLERGEFADAREGRPIRNVVSCGRPGGYDLRLVDPDTGASVAPGRVGELWLRGPSQSPGYWGREEATLRTFQAVTAEGEHGFLRTGDLCAIEDDELYVVGRLKEMLIVNGRNLYPHDIEHELRAHHPELAGGVGAVFSAPSLDDAHEQVEEVVLTHEVRGVRGEALAVLAAAMRHTVSREFGVRAGAVVLLRTGTTRRTTSGKIQRAEMRQLYLAGELVSLYSDRL